MSDYTLAQETRNRYLHDTGEMGQIILKYDWSQTEIGGINGWPQSLFITLGNLLHSNFPQFLFWGEDLICFYNDAYRPSLGHDGKHPAIGQKGRDVWPEIWADIYPLIEQVKTSGKPFWFEDRLLPIFRNNQLEDVYWTFSYSPAYGEGGAIRGVLVTCMETTQKVKNRKEIQKEISDRTRDLEKAHKQLVEANIYLQQIINSFKEPLQVLEPVFENGKVIDFRFKLTNAAYSAYANTTPEKLQNTRVGETFPGYFQTSSFINIMKTFQTGIQDTWEIHYTQDGLDLYNEMSAAKIGDEVIVHFTNFTKLKNLQLELIKKVQELERSNKNLEEFAYAASHDLKEPIRKVQVFTSQLKSKLNSHINENESALFSKIEDATERMALLIDDLMKFSYVSHQPIEKDVVNLNQLLEQVLEDLALDVQQKKAVISILPLPEIKGYARQLQQLFQNLLSNSLKYCKDDLSPKIRISADLSEEDGKHYNVIEVKDNGIGFDQQYAEKIFEMFARLHGKNKFVGNGIGLSIVKKIVENHQGKIKVQSEPGQGATFKIYLPVN